MTVLQDICVIAHGAAFPLHLQGKKSGAIPFFKVSDMNSAGNEEVLCNATHYIDEQTARELGAKVWPVGTIVFPKVGGALLTNKKRVLAIPGVFDNNIMGLVPNLDVVDGGWLRLWFEKIDLATLANTQALPSIRQSDIAKLKIAPPSIETQRETVARERLKLECLSKARTSCEAQLSDSTSLWRATLRESFLGCIPVTTISTEHAFPIGWERLSLLDVSRLESGHTPSRRRPEWWGGDVPWLALPDIRKLHGKYAYETTENTNDAGLANSSARLLPVGTVCLSRTASVGFTTILGKPMATSQDFCNWICDREKLDPEFLMYAFMASQEAIRELGSGAVHKTIYMPTIQSFHICAPRIEEQQRIACTLRDRLAAAEALTAGLKARLADIERLPQRLLAAAFA